MVLVFEFEDKNHGSVTAVLQQDVEKHFPVIKRGSSNLPEFRSNFQGNVFQKGVWENDLNEASFVWLLLGVTRKRDHSRLRRVMQEKSGAIEILKFRDDEELKNYLIRRPELSEKWFTKENL